MSIDIRDCDVEAIHIPGAIQPHGVLIALDPGSLAIIQVSANCALYFGVQPEYALGRPLSSLVGDKVSNDVLASSASNEPIRFEVNGGTFEALVHRHRGILIVEVERHGASSRSSARSGSPTEVAMPGSNDAALRTALVSLQRQNSVRELCAIAVETVRMLTGFDRVMMYRFGDDGHGDVLEEVTASGVSSYRGMRFPASDIPKQARDLYLLNWLRLIPDASYGAVALVKAAQAPTLDLTFATLRSVSPVHLEYLRNMDVAASMSVSLVADNMLWGLIACHHRTPRHVSFAARAACEVLGRTVALQIAAQEQLDLHRSRDALRGIEARLVDAMRSGHEDIATALVLRSDALLDLVQATGAAVCTESEIRTVGLTPSRAQLDVLVAWLAKAGGALVHTDKLAERHPPAVDYAHVASSLLAMQLPHGNAAYVLWFRPELVETVRWAGDPVKPVVANDDRIHPRNSFAAWTEVVRGRGEPWRSVELDAAEDLRRRALEIDLGNQIARAERAVRSRDELVAVVSHDLKSPLQVIAMSASALQVGLAGNAGAIATISRIERATVQMSTLIYDLLDLAAIESGRFSINAAACAASTLVNDALTMLAPLAHDKGLTLTSTMVGAPWVSADADRMLQVFTNLVGNAIRFTPSGGSILIAVTQSDTVVQFEVRDTGTGIEPSQLPHVFDRYWQARRSRNVGSGLGLYIVKGIVEAHGQHLWVDAKRGTGAAFYFTLAATPALV